MPTNRLPSDRKMMADRIANRFVCTCSTPVPRSLGAFDGHECGTCWRPIFSERQAAELVAEALNHCDDAAS